MDISDHDPRRLAEINRAAADAARVAYNFPPSVREERVQYYLAEAARLDALADQCRKQGDTP
jgi:hypothetical protein